MTETNLEELGPSRAHDLVDLVVLGRSQHEYTIERRNKASEQELPREVWTCNRGLLYLQADRGFVLDDLELELRQYPRYIVGLQACRGRLFVSRPRPDILPRGEAFPLEAVIAELGPAHVYLRNSVPMMLAYALLVPWVRRVRVWGADYTTATGVAVEPDRANAEYMVAVCRERGLQVDVCETSTLCAANLPPRIYGYADQAAAWRSVDKGLALWRARRRNVEAMSDELPPGAPFPRRMDDEVLEQPPPGGAVDDAPLSPLEAPSSVYDAADDELLAMRENARLLEECVDRELKRRQIAGSS